MHGDVTLGPLMYVLIGLMVVAALGALAVLVDVLRPRRRPVPGGWAAKLFWSLPQSSFLVAVIASRIIGQVTVVSTAAAVLFMVVAPLQVAYLLTVVFPKRGGVSDERSVG